MNLSNRILFTGMLIIGFFACKTETSSKQNTPFADCRYGAPNPIFNDTMATVKKHLFELSSQSATEQVQLVSGMSIELIQSGCEKPRQEFQFNLPVSTNTFQQEDWIVMTLDMFTMLGEMAEPLRPFLFWRSALEPRIGQIKLGSPVELEPGFFVKIDKISSNQSGKLIVVLYQE